jgi:hypothetical protein
MNWVIECKVFCECRSSSSWVQLSALTQCRKGLSHTWAFRGRYESPYVRLGACHTSGLLEAGAVRDVTAST